MKTLKYSRHREAILKFLAGRCDHPTAEVIYQNLKEEYPKISLGTVYRNLTQLSELGEIQRIPCGDSAEHFDGTVEEHPHFICTCCSSIKDMDIDELSSLRTLADKNIDGKIEKCQLVFFGKCSKCMEQSDDSRI